MCCVLGGDGLRLSADRSSIKEFSIDLGLCGSPLRREVFGALGAIVSRMGCLVASGKGDSSRLFDTRCVAVVDVVDALDTFASAVSPSGFGVCMADLDAGRISVMEALFGSPDLNMCLFRSSG